MKVRHLRTWLSSAATMTLAISAAATAQVSAPPVRETVDAKGVDLVRGAFQASATDLTIGPSGSHGLTYSRSWEGDGWRDNVSAGISGSTANPVVTIDGASDSFTQQSDGSYVPDQGNGATLTVSGSTYTYTSSAGTVAQFADASTFGINPRALSNIGWITSLTYPDGNVATFSYKTDAIQNGTFSTQEVRLRSVVNSFGYMLHLDYAASSLSSSTAFTWSQVTAVTAINTQVEACDPSADTCSVSSSWPRVTYGYYASPNNPYTPPINAVTDPMGRTSQYSYGTYHGTDFLTGQRRPGASSDDVGISYHDYLPGGESLDVRVQTVSTAGSSWSYAYDDSVSQRRTVTTINPNNTYRTLVIDTNIAEPVSSTNEVGAQTSYLFNVQGHLGQMTYPEGNAVNYTYDGRGNVTAVTQLPKPSQNGGVTISTTAYYDPNCANAKICNQPIWTRDANGNQTDYSYDAGIGRVTSVTAPAGANGARPQVRYSYANVNGAGLWLLGGTSVCRTTASCASGADETRTDTAFGNASQNYLPLSSTSRAGDKSVSTTTSVSYDAIGNLVTATDPVGAQTRLSYDADREVVETISADPDGSGPLKPRAVRINYNGDGTVASKEVGTDTGGNFQSLQQVVSSYDGYGRKVEDAATAGGTTYGVTDYGYDGMGRPLCTAQRMNSATFANHTGACTLAAQGADGPDRITLSDYDGANRVQRVTSGYGTNVQADIARTSFTLNGQTATATDANGNQTSYAYDGFDRLTTTTYPGGSYEQLGLDTNGNVTTRRLRDGQNITYVYDALNRRVADHNPQTNVSEVNASYTYDNLGQLTRAGDDNGWYSAWEYDALGRATREYSNVYGNRFQYDAAGHMTQTSWDDGFYVTYSYDALGEMTGIAENSGMTLAFFNYDDLGRRTALGRANGASTWYGYDGASRLSSMTQNISSASNGSTYGYNAAGQITSRTSSNDAYAWTGAVTTNRSYSVNALNQYTQSGGITPTYDGRGNLTSGGSTTYVYDTRNQLYTTGGGGLFYRPPTGLLSQLLWPTNNEAFAYAGDKLTTETANGSILRRYVYGPGSDEPLIWYEGNGTSDRRFLHADERGSIVAVTDSSGNVSAINTYDEYGIPGANNQGRFQYTGQKWLPELGMYDYKARMYSPTLGRFLQTDPIGYGDGLNWYNYVGGDPVNATDSGGTDVHSNVCYGNCPNQTGNGGVNYTDGGTLGGLGYSEVIPPDVNVFGHRYGLCELSPITCQNFSLVRNVNVLTLLAGIGPAELPVGVSTPQRGDTKPIPPCMQAFLNRAHPGFDYSKVQLVNGLPPGFDITDNNVTFGNTIYLDPDIFRDVGLKVGATTTVFHEITHARDYASGQLSVGGYILDAARYGSHDSIPSEIRANAFMNQAMTEYKNSPEAKGCPR